MRMKNDILSIGVHEEGSKAQHTKDDQIVNPTNTRTPYRLTDAFFPPDDVLI